MRRFLIVFAASAWLTSTVQAQAPKPPTPTPTPAPAPAPGGVPEKPAPPKGTPEATKGNLILESAQEAIEKKVA